MKKLLKSKIFWTILIIILLIGGFVGYKIATGGPTVQYDTEAVKKGNLTQTVSATGAVESAQDISLNFKSSGRLVFLSVKEGDKVKAGQALARLDSASLSAQVQQNRANVASAQADLDRVIAGASSQDINVSQEQLVKAKNDLDSLKTESLTQLSTLRDKNLDAINNSNFTAGVALNKVFNYLINSNTTSGLVTVNTDLENSVENQYFLIKKNLDDAKLLTDKANSDKTSDSITAASDGLYQVLFSLNSFLSDSFRLADAIIVNSSYPQATKDAIKTDINTQQTANNTSLTSLQTAKSNLVNSVNSYSTQIQAAQNSLAIYQAQFDLKNAGPRSFEISSAEAKVAQARAQLSQVFANLAEYSIVAPIDGTITAVNFKVGEQTSMSEPAIKMMGTENFQIKVDIPESDIAKIKVGDKAVIQLDAFGSDQIFSGAISFIDPAQTVIQDVIYYKTTISFNQDSKNSQIKSGMSADVAISTAEKNDVLYIPQRAVKVREAILGEVPVKYVEVLVNGQVEQKTVEVGLRGDNGLVEVISGLQEGEQVITFKR